MSTRHNQLIKEVGRMQAYMKQAGDPQVAKLQTAALVEVFSRYPLDVVEDTVHYFITGKAGNCWMPVASEAIPVLDRFDTEFKRRLDLRVFNPDEKKHKELTGELYKKGFQTYLYSVRAEKRALQLEDHTK